MKSLHHLLQLTLLTLTLLSLGAPRAAAQTFPTATTSAVTKTTATNNITADLDFGTGRTLLFESGSTLSLLGTFSGTPTGGTLNLSNVSLTLAAVFVRSDGSYSDPSWLTLSKSKVGLGNVDNTSDANKPVSTAQAAADALKANIASPTFTGTPTAPTAAAGTNTTQLATTAFVNSADAILANPRAARQALVMGADGFATVGAFTFGLNDLSLSFVISSDSTTNGAQRVFFSGADEPNTVNIRYNPSTRTFSSSNTGLNYVAPDNLPAHYTWVRTAQVSALYRNGIAVQSGITNSTNYLSGTHGWGGNGVSVGLAATYSELFLFNRALSAAEVLALYQQGAPAAADYGPFGTNDASASVPGASNTSMVTGANSDFSSATGYWTLAGGATISGGVANIPNGGRIDRSVILAGGKRYRITGTVTGGSLNVTNLDQMAFALPVGVGSSVVITTLANNNPTILAFQNISGIAATLDNLTVVPLGLFSAPDAQQPGNGYQRRDTSGNRADLTLNATGVTHRLPSDAPNSVRASLTWAGTHEAKSLLGQIALPLNAVITSIVTTASVASTGSGLTVGSVTTPALFVAANSYTTARKLHTLATALPAGTAANDLNIVLDPDTANYTGTIQVAVNYLIAP